MPKLRLLVVEELQQGDGQGIDFLAGGAAGHPDAEHGPCRPVGHQGQENPGLERLERLRVAEELRDADQEVLVQVLGLGGIVPEDREVVPRVLKVPQGHAAAGCAGVSWTACSA